MQHKSITVICAALVLNYCLSSLPVSALDFELPTAFARTPEENALETTEPAISPRRSAARAASAPDTSLTFEITPEQVRQGIVMMQERAPAIYPAWFMMVSVFPDNPKDFLVAVVSATKYKYMSGDKYVLLFGDCCFYSCDFIVDSNGYVTFNRELRNFSGSADEPATGSIYQYSYVENTYSTLHAYTYYVGSQVQTTRALFPYASVFPGGIGYMAGTNIMNMVIPVEPGCESMVRQNSLFKMPVDAFDGSSSGGGGGSSGGNVGTGSTSGKVFGSISESGEVNMDVNVDVKYPDEWTADYGKWEEPTAGASLDAELENTSNSFLSGVSDYLKIFLNIRGSIGFFWEAADRVFKAFDIWTIILFALFMGIVFYLVRGV